MATAAVQLDESFAMLRRAPHAASTTPRCAACATKTATTGGSASTHVTASSAVKFPSARQHDSAIPSLEAACAPRQAASSGTAPASTASRRFSALRARKRSASVTRHTSIASPAPWAVRTRRRAGMQPACGTEPFPAPLSATRQSSATAHCRTPGASMCASIAPANAAASMPSNCAGRGRGKFSRRKRIFLWPDLPYLGVSKLSGDVD